MSVLLDPADGITALDPNVSVRDHLKAVWNGTGGSGRTSFLMTLLHGTFPTNEYMPSVYDNACHSFALEKGGQTMQICVGFWDLQGARDGDPVMDVTFRGLSMPGTDVLFLVVDAARRQTLVDVEEKWLPQALEHVPQSKCVLLVLKTDLRDDAAVLEKLERRGETVISADEADAWGAKHGLAVIQVSAKTGDGMPQFLGKLFRIALAPTKPKPESRLAAFFGKLFGSSKRTTTSDSNPAFSLK